MISLNKSNFITELLSFLGIKIGYVSKDHFLKQFCELNKFKTSFELIHLIYSIELFREVNHIEQKSVIELIDTILKELNALSLKNDSISKKALLFKKIEEHNQLLKKFDIIGFY